MKPSSSPKRSKTRWIFLGCGALATLAILCTFLGILTSRTVPETPTPTQIALPTPTQPPTATPSPTPTAPPTLPVRLITIDGYDPASDSIIDPINIWIDYENRDAGIVTHAHHGDSVKFLRREGDGILIETADGTQGWVTYWFIKEFKDEYLATPTPPAPTATSPPAPTPAGQCPGGCWEHLPGCDIKGNISVSTGEKIYHVPGQRDYEECEITPEKGERWFCTEEEATAAGWRRAQH